MTHAPNQISEDFEPYAGKLASLMARDEGFTKLMRDYEELNDKIYSSEQQIEPRSDIRLETLKKQRLALKDRIILALSTS